MKKNYFITLVLFFLIFSNSFSQTGKLSGKVYVENSEDYGVFVYIDGLNSYDITDIDGEFEITGLTVGKKYKVVFQKEDFPIVTKIVNIAMPENKLEIDIKKYRGVKTFKTKGTIKSEIRNKDIFIKLNDKSYGIFAKPNVTFSVQLEAGKYTAEIIQEGSYNKKIEFVVSEDKEINNIGGKRNGIYYLQQKEKHSLLLNIKNKINKGYIYLYKNDVIVSSKKIDSKTTSVKIDDIERGLYIVEVKAFGYDNYKANVVVNGNTINNIELTQLVGQNKISLNILPDVSANIKLYQNRVKISEHENVRNMFTFKGLDPRKNYEIIIEAPKYKTFRLKEVYPGEELDVHLVRDIKGYLITGNVYPFTSDISVKLLSEDEILDEDSLAETKTKGNGYFELETDSTKVKPTKIIVIAKGYRNTVKEINPEPHKKLSGVNIDIEPIVTSIFGKVNLKNAKSSSDVLVVIEELNLWQRTNKKGEFYFSNIPEGVYTITYKKMGYKTKSTKSIVIVKNRIKEIEETLIPKGKIIFRSDIVGYNLTIEGNSYVVENKVYERELTIGDIDIKAEKDNYLDYTTKVILDSPGEITEVKIDLISLGYQREMIEDRIREILSMLEEKKLKTAEMKIMELKKKRKIELYKGRVSDLESTLQEYRKDLFDKDREIAKELSNIRETIEEKANENISYFEKRRQLDAIYKESLDYLEQIMIEVPYTTKKYDLYLLKGDIYKKMGMSTIAKNIYKEAKKYQEVYIER